MQKHEHPYEQVNLKRNNFDEINYEQLQMPWGAIEDYSIISKLGRGRYSHVFLGRDIAHNRKVAIKVLLPIKKQKINREFLILKMLKHPNIIKLVDVVRMPQLRTAALVFEHFQHTDFRELYPKLLLQDIRIYMKQLLQALDYLHSNGIMHRDIKPYNVLINPATKQLKIIDFGLSEFYFPNKENNVKVSSLYYKGPELFFSNTLYDYRVDCWAAGMIMAGMVFQRTPFLAGNQIADQIMKISALVGTRELVDYIKDYKLTERGNHQHDNICFDLVRAYHNQEIREEKKSTLEEFITPKNEQNATWEALDLILKLLSLDFKIRFTAKEALEHPFFNPQP